MEALEGLSLALVPSPIVFYGSWLGCEDNSCPILGCSSLRPEKRAPFANIALLFEVEGFSSKFSTTVCLMGGRSSSATFMSKDEGFSLGRIESLVSQREQDMGLLAEAKYVYKLLCMSYGEGLVVEVPEGQPKDVKDPNLEVCSKEGVSGFGSPNRGPSDVESLSNPFCHKFISFSKFLGLLVIGYEKEIVSLLRKMETRKVLRALAVKRRPSSTPCLVREL